MGKLWISRLTRHYPSPTMRDELKKTPTHHHHQVLYHTKFFDVVDDTYDEEISGITFANQKTFQVSCAACSGSSHCRNLQKAAEVSSLWGIRPVLLGATLLGLTHRQPRTRSRFKSPTFMFSLVTCLGLWANFFRFFTNYIAGEDFGTSLFMKITVHVFYGQVAMTSLIFLTHISPRLPHFFRTWDNYLRAFQCDTGHRLRSRAICSLIIVSIFITLMASFNGIVIYKETANPGRNIMAPASRFLLNLPDTVGEVSAVIILVLYLFFTMYVCLVWVWPTALLVCICYGLQHNFRLISKEIATKFQTMDVSTLERYRRRHQTLCRITKSADALFSFYNLLQYLTAIPLLCFCIYNFAFRKSDTGTPLVVSLFILHVVSIIGQLWITTLAASSLSSQATAPHEELLDVNFDVEQDCFHRKSIQVMVFLHRLAHSHIGLTAWNLFNINRGTIMMVVTMVLSYVFVLIKFGLTLEPLASHYNCSTSEH